MNLVTGTRLGLHELLCPIGAGGRGEVYRARDPKLGRDVAITVLPAAYAADAARPRRLEQDARAAGIFNQPSILTIYNIGTQQPRAPYIVSEFGGEQPRFSLGFGSAKWRGSSSTPV